MNILLTSVGRRSYLVEYFKEALNGEGEVHVMNSSDLSPAFQVADKATVSPLTYDKNYIPFLLEYCQENRIKAIISLLDIDLPIMAKNKNKFEQIGTKILVADYDFVEICNDKWKTYEFLTKNGFRTPRTYLKKEDAFKAIKEGRLEYPLMVKPRWGMASIAVYEADSEEELNVFFEKTKRNILKSYLKYESSQNIEQSVLIQEKLKGQEYGMDVMNDLNGNFVSTSIKIKYAMRSGETDCAITTKNDDIAALGRRLSEISKHPANLDVDIFLVDEKPYVLEMNARFGGGYPFSHLASVNLPEAIVKWLKGETVSSKKLTPEIGVKAQKNIQMVRL